MRLALAWGCARRRPCRRRLRPRPCAVLALDDRAPGRRGLARKSVRRAHAGAQRRCRRCRRLGRARAAPALRLAAFRALAPSLGGRDAPAPRKMGLRFRRRVVAAAAGSAPARRHQSRARPLCQVPLVRSVRSGHGRAHDERGQRLTAPYRDSPWRIGYFSDNEVGWWSGALFLFFSQKPAENYTKQHLGGAAAAALSRRLAEFRARFRAARGRVVVGPVAASARADAAAPGRDGHARDLGLDRRSGLALLRAVGAGDPRRRSRRALSRRPAADLLRPRRGQGRGAPCRRALGQL